MRGSSAAALSRLRRSRRLLFQQPKSTAVVFVPQTITATRSSFSGLHFRGVRIPLTFLRQGLAGRARVARRTIARVIFCVAGGEMVLLHSFVKKTQKTPSRDIDLALRRKRELD